MCVCVFLVTCFKPRYSFECFNEYAAPLIKIFNSNRWQCQRFGGLLIHILFILHCSFPPFISMWMTNIDNTIFVSLFHSSRQQYLDFAIFFTETTPNMNIKYQVSGISWWHYLQLENVPLNENCIIFSLLIGLHTNVNQMFN